MNNNNRRTLLDELSDSDSESDMPVVALDHIRTIIPRDQLENNERPVTGLRLGGMGEDDMLFQLDERDPILQLPAAGNTNNGKNDKNSRSINSKENEKKNRNDRVSEDGNESTKDRDENMNEHRNNNTQGSDTVENTNRRGRRPNDDEDNSNQSKASHDENTAMLEKSSNGNEKKDRPAPSTSLPASLPSTSPEPDSGNTSKGKRNTSNDKRSSPSASSDMEMSENNDNDSTYLSDVSFTIDVSRPNGPTTHEANKKTAASAPATQNDTSETNGQNVQSDNGKSTDGIGDNEDHPTTPDQNRPVTQSVSSPDEPGLLPEVDTKEEEIKNEYFRALEQYQIDKLDREILAAEEQEFMERLERDICEQEKREEEAERQLHIDEQNFFAKLGASIHRAEEMERKEEAEEKRKAAEEAKKKEAERIRQQQEEEQRRTEAEKKALERKLQYEQEQEAEKKRVEAERQRQLLDKKKRHELEEKRMEMERKRDATEKRLQPGKEKKRRERELDELKKQREHAIAKHMIEEKRKRQQQEKRNQLNQHESTSTSMQQKPKLSHQELLQKQMQKKARKKQARAAKRKAILEASKRQLEPESRHRAESGETGTSSLQTKKSFSEHHRKEKVQLRQESAGDLDSDGGNFVFDPAIEQTIDDDDSISPGLENTDVSYVLECDNSWSDMEDNDNATLSDDFTRPRRPCLNWEDENLDRKRSSPYVLMTDYTSDPSIVKVTKYIPRRLEAGENADEVISRSNINSFFSESRLKANSKFLKFYVRSINRNSWRLDVYCLPLHIKTLQKSLANWVYNELLLYKFRRIEKLGVERTFQLKSAQSFGALVNAVSSGKERLGLFMTVKNAETSQVAKAAKGDWIKYGAIVVTLDGQECKTPATFKLIKDAASGPKVALKLKVIVHSMAATSEKNSLSLNEFKSEPYRKRANLVLDRNVNPVEATSTSEVQNETLLPPTKKAKKGRKEEVKIVSHSSCSNIDFLRFNNKFREIVKLEYHNSGINELIAKKSMAKRHSELHGDGICDEKCPCFLDLPRLTDTVVADQLRNGKFRNPLHLKDGDYPVGLVGNFAATFMPKLSEEYPQKNSSFILNLLIEMWGLHQTKFGTKCTEFCSCKNGWESEFKKGNLKNNATGRAAATTSSEFEANGRKSNTEAAGRKSTDTRKKLPVNNKMTANNPSNASEKTQPNLNDKKIPKKKRSSSETNGNEDSMGSSSRNSVSANNSVGRIGEHNSRQNQFAAGTKRKKRSSEDSGDNAAQIGSKDEPIPKKKRMDGSVPGKTQQSKTLDAKVTSPYGAFEVVFDCRRALGFYCETENDSSETRCSIISICPRSQSANENRLQAGTLILSARKENEQDWHPVKTQEDIKNNFEDANNDGCTLAILFINTNVTAKKIEEEANARNKLWTPEGHWNGHSICGWDGGASSIDPLNSIIMQKKFQQLTGKAAMHDPVPVAAPLPVQAVPRKPSEWTAVKIPRALTNEKTGGLLKKKSGAGNSLQGRKKIRFADSFERREYDRGSLPYEFYVRPSDSMLSEDQVLHHRPEEENATLDSLSDITENKTCNELLEYFENGALANTKSPDDLIIAHDKIKNKLSSIYKELNESSSDRRLLITKADLKRKEVVLKVHINAFHIMNQARSLKQWEHFQVRVESLVDLKMPLIGTTEQGSTLKSEVFLQHEVGQEPLPLKSLPERRFSSTIEYDTFEEPYCCNHNPMMTPNREIDLCFTLVDANRKETSIGSIPIRMSDLHKECPQTHEWKAMTIDIVPNDYLVGGKLNIRARRTDLPTVKENDKRIPYVESKRYQACRLLNTVISWIDKFKHEARENADFRKMSADIRVTDNISLLHSAILLKERPLVQMLLERGANPNGKSKIGSPFSLVQNMLDGRVERRGLEEKENEEDDELSKSMHTPQQQGSHDLWFRQRLEEIKELLKSKSISTE